jgi:hypothetical protein
MNPLVLGKIASIERSVTRAREEFTSAGANFARDFTHQDAAVLNVLRTCETAIDLANVIVGDRNSGCRSPVATVSVCLPMPRSFHPN